MSVPLGGTISTMVTKSPLANFCPRRERCSIGTAGIGTGPVPLLTCATAVVGSGLSALEGGLFSRHFYRAGSQAPPHQLPPAVDKISCVLCALSRRDNYKFQYF